MNEWTWMIIVNHSNTDQLDTTAMEEWDICDLEDDKMVLLSDIETFPLGKSLQKTQIPTMNGTAIMQDTDDDNDGTLDLKGCFPIDPTEEYGYPMVWYWK